MMSMPLLQVIGLGTVIMTPLIGNLSDEYGRKSLLTLPMVASIIPLGTYLPCTYLYVCLRVNVRIFFLYSFPFGGGVNLAVRFSDAAIMAYSRETNFFYAYFVIRTLTAMVGESVVICLALAYVVR